ncbi:hypothetical protein ECG_00863 [Echinococcus granulosus]|uniref:Leucine-rich repeat-containing protein 27 n=1 Tax=Echinococcus granulosus TaxID=6210 RepID=A0A068W9G8_ECHGR|nr:hypothetical protein ECG_00863 [Echinococcus granulosus]CDS16258.1 hypothetical protein EgrG_000867800 [Echinococcus granulosus]
MENLIGLNIEGNPLRFPPKNIINRGSKYVLKYLKECYAKRTHLENEIKAQASSFIDPQTYIDELAIENVNKAILSRESGQDTQTTSRTLPSLYKSKLHRRIVEKLRKFPEIRSGPLVHSCQSQRHALTHQSGIKLVSDESVRQSEMKERSRRKRRWDKMCQASALQRWKDRQMVYEWKTNYRNKQNSLFSIYQEKLPKEIKEESRKRVQVAPFGVTPEATFVISSAELEKLKTAARPSILPDSRPQPRSGSFVLQLEKDRRAWDKVLIDEISEQVYVLNAKMDNPCLPKVLADAEMDLANALQLQLRLKSRRDVLTQLKTATNPTAFMQ